MTIPTYFLDTEFDGFNGPLISLALVPLETSGQELYLRTIHEATDPWVKEHVMSVIGNVKPHQDNAIARTILTFLDFNQPPKVKIIADWPDDFSYLMKAVITGPGKMPSFKPLLGMVLDLSLTTEHSQVPHNALWDARAMRDDWKKKNP